MQLTVPAQIENRLLYICKSEVDARNIKKENLQMSPNPSEIYIFFRCLISVMFLEMFIMFLVFFFPKVFPYYFDKIYFI